MSEYSNAWIDMRRDNRLTSADLYVAARHVDSSLLDLSHISWRICVADQSTDHSPPHASPPSAGPTGKTQGRQGGQ